MTLRPKQGEMPERLSSARHEAGHVLAAWWNGQCVYAVEMRSAEEGGDRRDDRGRVVDAATRAYVEATKFIAAPALAAAYPEMVAHTPPELLREMVARDLLYTLAGPAAEWRNQCDPEKVCACLAHHLEEWIGGCADDLDKAGDLLALLPEEEREDVHATACQRASALVCRYWPELCALAEHLSIPERLEDESLDALLSETLGELQKWRTHPLEELDPPRLDLGAAEVVAWWERSEGAAAEWRLAATVDRVPLSPGLTLERLDADDLDAMGWDTPHPSGWYWLESDGGADAIGTAAPPGGGSLRDFLAGLVADKLEELRRDPDSQRHRDPEESGQTLATLQDETAPRMESPQ